MSFLIHGPLKISFVNSKNINRFLNRPPCIKSLNNNSNNNMPVRKLVASHLRMCNRAFSGNDIYLTPTQSETNTNDNKTCGMDNLSDFQKSPRHAFSVFHNQTGLDSRIQKVETEQIFIDST